MIKKICFWILAVVITLGASVYQRLTGPTHAKRLKIELAGEEYNFKLPRSGDEVDCPVLLEGLPQATRARLFWRKYPSDQAFQALVFESTAQGLQAALPQQPPAGKLEYYLSIEGQAYFEEAPLVIRFKGNVPAWALIPHIIFMFISMLLGSYTLLLALDNNERYRMYLKVTTVMLVIGGFIFGPLVQKYAFGMYWSGFPYGGDLTDNKTLIAFLFLVAALVAVRTAWSRLVTVVSIIALYVVFSIPHSMRGSELDHTTGQVGTSEMH